MVCTTHCVHGQFQETATLEVLLSHCDRMVQLSGDTLLLFHNRHLKKHTKIIGKTLPKQTSILLKPETIPQPTPPPKKVHPKPTKQKRSATTTKNMKSKCSNDPYLPNYRTSLQSPLLYKVSQSLLLCVRNQKWSHTHLLNRYMLMRGLNSTEKERTKNKTKRWSQTLSVCNKSKSVK